MGVHWPGGVDEAPLEESMDLYVLSMPSCVSSLMFGRSCKVVFHNLEIFGDVVHIAISTYIPYSFATPSLAALVLKFHLG